MPSSTQVEPVHLELRPAEGFTADPIVVPAGKDEVGFRVMVKNPPVGGEQEFAIRGTAG